MSVQNQNSGRFGAGKRTGIYLMELRRHVSELNSRRSKLAGTGDLAESVVVRLHIQRPDKPSV